MATGVTMPISSQCPVVVSFFLECSKSSAGDCRCSSIGGQPSISMFPKPSCSRLGRSRPPTALAMLPRVSDHAVLGRVRQLAPAPTASSTITQARGIWLFYGRHGHDPRLPRPGRSGSSARSASPPVSPGWSSSSSRATRSRRSPSPSGSGLGDGLEREDLLERREVEAVGVGDGLIGRPRRGR